MEKRTYRVESDQTRLQVLAAIEATARTEPCFEVCIGPQKKDITAEQRGLYFVWMTKVGEVIGDTKDYYHQEFKKMFLVNIFRRDNPEYEAMIQALLSVKKQQDAADYEAIATWILDHTSIMKADKKQMSEYMTDIKNYCMSTLGIDLPVPDDGLIKYHEKKTNAPTST